MVGVAKSWSVTASDNQTADTNIGLVEGGGTYKAPHVNNTQRAIMAATKAWANQISGAKTTGGSADAQTLTSDAAGAISSSYAAGMRFTFKAGYTNTGACTLNVDGVGAVAIRKGAAYAALAAGDITAGGIYDVVYESSTPCFVLLNVTGQPLSAELTAFAALADTANTYLRKTGDAAYSLDSYATVATNIGPTYPNGSAATPAIAFANEPDCGLYVHGTNQVGIAAAGVAKLVIGSTLIQTNSIPYGTGNGSESAPSFTFNSDLNTGFYWIGADNMALTIGGTKRADFSTTITDFVSVPVRARTATSSEASGTLTSASANKVVKATAGVTINDGVFTAGDHIEIYNDSDVSITITQDTGMTLRLAGTTTTGNRTLAARGIAVVYFDADTDATVAGTGVS